MQRNNLESSYKAIQGALFYIEHPYCNGQPGHFSASTPSLIFPGVFRFLPKHCTWLGSYPYCNLTIPLEGAVLTKVEVGCMLGSTRRVDNESGFLAFVDIFI